MDFELYSKTNLASIEFDEHQKAKIGLALQALADQIVPTLNGKLLCKNDDNSTDSSSCYVDATNQYKSTNEITTLKLQQIKDETIASSATTVKEQCRNQPSKNTFTNEDDSVETHIINSLSQPQEQFETSNDSSTYFALAKEEPLLQEFKIETSTVGEKTLSTYSQYLSTGFKKEPMNMEFIGPYDGVLSRDGSSCEKNYENVDSMESDSQNEEDDQESDVIDYKSYIYYICPQCGVNCGTWKDWESHAEKKHMSNTMSWLNLSSLIKKDDESYYQCLDCNKKLSQKLNFTKLQAHRIKHLPHKDYVKCSLCHKGFAEYNIYRHLKDFHGMETHSNSIRKYIKIFCPICQKPQQNIKCWSHHLSVEHNYVNIKSQVTQLNDLKYSCQLCQKKMMKSTIRTHMLTHEPHKSFQCTLCEKYETCMSSATKHLREKHLSIDENKKLHKCSHCKSTFAKKLSLWNHNRKYHKNEILKCAVCDTEFLNASDLLFHNLTNHTVDRKEDGAVVQASIPSSSTKPQINQLHKRITNDSPTNGTVNKQELKLQKHEIKTSTTGYEEFLSDEASDEQMENIGTIEFDPQDEENDKDEQESLNMCLSSFIRYICPECGVDCITYSDWKSHTEKQHMSNKIAWLNLSTTTNGNGELYYQCLDCKYQFNVISTFKELQLHHITHLPHREYMKCSFCDKRFHNHCSVNTHIKNSHSKLVHQYSKKKPFNPTAKYINIFCPICQQSQSTVKRWLEHLTEKHDYTNKIKSCTVKFNEFVYSCRICEKKIHRLALRSHMLLHEPNKSFQCTLCKNYHTVMAAASQHVREKHLDNDKKLLQCSYCPAFSCADKKALWLHSRNCHKDEILKCTVCDKQFLKASHFVSHIGLSNHTFALNHVLNKP